MALSDVKNKPELDILFADNDEGLITPANVRTLMASIQPKRGDMIKHPVDPFAIESSPRTLKFDESSMSSMDLFTVHPTGGQIIITAPATYFLNFTLTGRWSGQRDLIVGAYVNGVLRGQTTGKAGDGGADPTSLIVSQFHLEIEPSDVQAMVQVKLHSASTPFDVELDSASLEIEYEVMSIKV